jgi:hypothetical protein
MSSLIDQKRQRPGKPEGFPGRLLLRLTGMLPLRERLLATIRFDQDFAVLQMQLERTVPLTAQRSLGRAQPGTERNEQGLLSGGLHVRLSG